MPKTMSLQQEADQERLKFLIRLDQAENVNVSNWEAMFIESHISKAYVAFSPKQREAVDKMIEKYGVHIGWL